VSRATSLIAVLSLLALGALPPGVASQTATPPDGWRTFEGTWSVTGTRQTLPTQGDAPAAIARVSGAIVLAGGEALGRGFLGEAITFFDGKDLGVGWSVWTDDHGDRVFSALKGEAMATGHRIVGTITGGTGRWAGVAGEYSFVWQYVVEAEKDVIQGRAVGLQGRVRLGEAPK
jgi:hypothetical protein